jgi:hypothetical protein
MVLPPENASLMLLLFRYRFPQACAIPNLHGFRAKRAGIRLSGVDGRRYRFESR